MTIHREIHITFVLRTLPLIAAISLLFSFRSQGQVAYSSAGDPFLSYSWTVNNGLPQTSVNAILQNAEGYLWLGTYGGLVRFDGVQFKVLSKVSIGELQTYRVLSLLEGKDSSLWIGTEASGLLLFKKGLFTPIQFEGGRDFEGPVGTLSMDSTGTIWVGMQRGGLFRVVNDGKGGYTLLHTPLQPQFSRPGVTCLWSDVDGSLWIGGTGALAHLQGAAVTTYTLSVIDSSVNVVAMSRDIADVVWCTTSDRRIFRIVGEAAERYPEEWLHDSYAFDEVVDRTRPERFLASITGLLRYHQGRFYSMGTPQWNNGWTLRTNFIDRENNIWFGSNTEGLMRFRRATFTMHSVLGPVQNITSLSRGAGGVIWVGLNCGGVGVLNVNGTPMRHPVSDLMEEHCVWSVLEDRRGMLWIGTWGSGVFELDPRRPGATVRLHSRTTGFPADVVVATLESADGAIWFGTIDAGLIRYSAGSVRAWTTAHGLPGNEVRALYEEAPGRLWIGTNRGLALLQNDSVMTFGNGTGMPAAAVRVITKDSAGTLWIGTYGSGIVGSDGERFVPITSNKGLYDNVVSHIVQDRNGFLWMGCNRGIWKSPVAELRAVFDGRLSRVTSIFYGLDDGLETLETNGGFLPSNLRTEDGDVWIPTTHGVARVHLAEIRANVLPPPVHIERITLDGIETDHSRPIDVHYDVQEVAIQYAALSFVAPQKIQFRYRLAGFNRDWVQAGDRRAAYFSHVTPGTYKFQVVAANNDGIWNEDGAEVTITFDAPYWETWWFRLLIVVALMSMGMLVVSSRLRSIRVQKEHQEDTSRQLIESQEEERQRIAGELHDGLGQELIVAKNRALLAAHYLPEDSEARKEIVQVADALTNALKNVRSIAYNLRPFQLDRLGLTETLRSTVRTIQPATSITFETEITNVDGLLPREAEIGLFRILQEALNNVVKHSAATRASVIITKDEETVVLRVQDDGKGFEHGVTAGGKPAYGFGLSGIIERVRMMDGMYKIASVPGGGTTVAVRIPVSIPKPPLAL